MRFRPILAGATIGRDLVAVLLRRLARAAGRRSARHGVRRHRHDRHAELRRFAGAGERHDSHRRDLHHRGLGRVALVAPQHRLVDREAHRASRRDRRRTRRDRAGQCGRQGDRTVRDHLPRADGRADPGAGAARLPGRRADQARHAGGRLLRRPARRHRRRRVGPGRHLDADRWRPCAAARSSARST